MEETVKVAPSEYKRLIQLEAKVQSLMGFANRTKYSVEREMIGGILGFSVNEVKDERSGK